MPARDLSNVVSLRAPFGGLQADPLLPDVPTLKEQGYPNMVAQGWFAMYAPAKTPPVSSSPKN